MVATNELESLRTQYTHYRRIHLLSKRKYTNRYMDPLRTEYTQIFKENFFSKAKGYEQLYGSSLRTEYTPGYRPACAWGIFPGSSQLCCSAMQGWEWGGDTELRERDFLDLYNSVSIYSWKPIVQLSIRQSTKQMCSVPCMQLEWNIRLVWPQ